MKIYLSENAENALNYRRILTVKTNIQRLKWATNLPKLPEEVNTSCTIVMDYCDEIMQQCVDNSHYFCNITEKEDEKIVELFKASDLLKKYLGSCCVLAGQEAQIVLRELDMFNAPAKIKEALKTGKNLILN